MQKVSTEPGIFQAAFAALEDQADNGYVPSEVINQAVLKIWADMARNAGVVDRKALVRCAEASRWKVTLI